MTDALVRGILSDVLLERSDDPAHLPSALCRHAVRHLPIDDAGLTVGTAEGLQAVVAATGGLGRTLEDLQFLTGEGPCVDAFSTDRFVAQPDLAATGTTRWPVYGPAAVAAGVGAVFAFPLSLGGIRLGVLDLYRTEPGSLSDPDTARALSYADAAAVLLLYLQQEAGAELNPQLEVGWSERGQVHQATGMIAVQAAVSPTQALLLLRARAYAEDRPIHDVATDVLRRALRFEPPDAVTP